MQKILSSLNIWINLSIFRSIELTQVSILCAVGSEIAMQGSVEICVQGNVDFYFISLIFIDTHFVSYSGATARYMHVEVNIKMRMKNEGKNSAQKQRW